MKDSETLEQEIPEEEVEEEAKLEEPAETEGETPEAEESEKPAEPEDSGEDEGDISIEIEGETPEGDDRPKDEFAGQEAPEWVRNLRKEVRALKKENRSLKGARKEEEKELKLGKEPEIDDPDIDFDKAKFKAKWDKWNSDRMAYEKQESERKEEEKRQKEEWEQVNRDYEAKKAALNVKDYDEVEDVIGETLSVPQQSIVMSGAKNPALVFLALSRNPSQLEKLSGIKNQVKFAFAVADLESKMKVTRKRAETKPDRKVEGSSPVHADHEKTLEKLLAAGLKSGNMTKYREYKRNMEASGSA